MKFLSSIIFLLLICIWPDISFCQWEEENLYDKVNKSYFIPYQLWTGAEWDGSKHSKINHHVVDKNFMGDKRIIGPIDWIHPYSKKKLKVYKRTNKDKIQYFVFTGTGIGRVFDNREDIYYKNDVKFPAGFGWRELEYREFTEVLWRGKERSTRKIGLKINKLQFNSEKRLERLEYTYYVGGSPDHQYIYAPNVGMVSETDLTSKK